MGARDFVATPATIGQVLKEAREATPPTEEEVAARAPRWRERLTHLSQAEAAARCGLHQPRLAKIEGEMPGLRMDDLERVAKALGFRVEIRLVRKG